MAFLANLVGAEHIERFIPVAEARNERDLSSKAADRGSDSTIQQPTPPSPPHARCPSSWAPNVRRSRRQPPKSHAMSAKPRRSSSRRQGPRPSLRQKSRRSPERTGPSDAARDQVVADAARLVQWGRKWFELPELIARMADRPSLPDVRRILKENKAAIEKKAGNP